MTCTYIVYSKQETFVEIIGFWMTNHAYHTILFGRDPPKVACTPKTAAFKKYPTNFFTRTKAPSWNSFGITKPNKVSKLPNAKY